MRLDPSVNSFRFKELRVLAAVQLGMRNHEYVPAQLVVRFANLKGGQGFKTLQKVLKNKFVTHVGGKRQGYKLTYLGYDYLALQTMMKRGLIKDVLSKIGVGKQSDIYKCVTPDGQYVALKLTRLGRNSFRTIKKNREYIQGRTNYNWLYLSRLSSIREFLFMQMLHNHNFPTPKPIDTNRHAILMSLVDGDTLCHVLRVSSQKEVRLMFEKSIEILVKFAKHGLIHGDYNEFNLMVNQNGNKLTVIDFPQCISIKHPNAKTYFQRDVECIYKFYDRLGEKSYEEALKHPEEGSLGPEKQFDASQYPMPVLEEIEIETRLDHEVKKVGHFSLEEFNELENYRTEEERMRSQMKEVERLREEEDESEEEQDEENEEETQENEQKFKQYEMENEKERKRIQKHEGLNEIEQIEKAKEIHKYDEELQNLLNGLEDNLNLNVKQVEDEESESSSEEERFKGLTPYEIRMKIKEEKRVERQRKKQAMNTEEFIKKALKKGSSKKNNYVKGNHGNKAKIKETNYEIKHEM